MVNRKTKKAVKGSLKGAKGSSKKTKPKKAKGAQKVKKVNLPQTPKEWHEFGSKSKYYKLRSLDDPNLQQEVEKWYDKLAKEGFEDIELSGTTKRHGNEVPFKPADLPPRRSITSKAKQQYYSAWSTFYMHHEYFFENFTTKRTQIVFKMHLEGATLMDIQKALRKARLKKRSSNWSISQDLKKWDEVIMKWNKENPDGEFYTPLPNLITNT